MREATFLLFTTWLSRSNSFGFAIEKTKPNILTSADGCIA
jgi:hypothetical protein